MKMQSRIPLYLDWNQTGKHPYWHRNSLVTAPRLVSFNCIRHGWYYFKILKQMAPFITIPRDQMFRLSVCCGRLFRKWRLGVIETISKKRYGVSAEPKSFLSEFGYLRNRRKTQSESLTTPVSDLQCFWPSQTWISDILIHSHDSSIHLSDQIDAQKPTSDASMSID